MNTHNHTPSARRNLRRNLRAQWRDTIVLIGESGNALLLFAGLVIGGSLLFFFFYRPPENGKCSTNWERITDPKCITHGECSTDEECITYGEALYGTFALLFFQDSLAFPNIWYLDILYFIIPILGLIVVADGVIRFGVALTNKKERGQKWQIAMASTYSKHIIVCGLGKIGYRVILELIDYDREVVGIDIDPNGRFIEKIKGLGIPVIIADARRTENLIKVGVQVADAVIPCTDNELTNLDIALDAREINPKVKVVMRMYDPDLAQRVQTGFGIHTAFSASALAAPIFAAASMRINVKSSFMAGDTRVYIAEMLVHAGSDIEGWSLEKLEKVLDVSIVSYVQDGATQLHPAPDLQLEAGCRILILASLEKLHKLESMNNAR